jgi:hypothetical protein
MRFSFKAESSRFASQSAQTRAYPVSSMKARKLQGRAYRDPSPWTIAQRVGSVVTIVAEAAALEVTTHQAAIAQAVPSDERITSQNFKTLSLRAQVPNPRSRFPRPNKVASGSGSGTHPTPEIGLQDLKVRRNSSVNKSSVSRNSSQGSSSNSVTAKNSAKINSGCRGENQRTPGFLEKGIGGLLNGCKCLDETVSSNAVIIKSSNGKNNSTSESETHAKKEKLLEVKMKKKKDEKQQQEGKQAMSRHRTSEWLKELPHAVYPPEGQTH